MTTTPTVSVAALQLHLAAAEALGIARADVLDPTEVDPAALADPELRLPLPAVVRLIERIDACCPAPSYGLWLGEHFHPAKLSLVGYLLMNACNLRDSLERLIRFKRVLGEGFLVDLAPDAEHGWFYGLRQIRVPTIARAVQEWHQAASVVAMRVLTGRSVSPLRADFAHPEPPWRDAYDLIFRCPLRFGCERTGLVLDDALLDLPIQHANPKLAHHFEKLAGRALLRLGDGAPASQRVMTILLHTQPGGEPTIESVARELAMSTRKLQAALQAEHTTYRKLLRQARLDLARHYLKDQNLSITDISYLVGFSEPSAFHRAFKRWTGQTPAVFRRA